MDQSVTATQNGGYVYKAQPLRDVYVLNPRKATCYRNRQLNRKLKLHRKQRNKSVSSPAAARQGRKDDLAAQKAAGATTSNFDYDQHNRKGSEGTHVSGMETKFLRQNYDKRDALASLKAQQASGAEMGQRAQNQMARMEQSIANRDAKKAARIEHVRKLRL